jgi:hypothetical protein
MPRFAVASSPLTLLFASLATLSACGEPTDEDMMALGTTMPTDGTTAPTPTPTGPTPSPTPAMTGTSPMPTTTAPMPTETAMPMPTETAPMPTDTAPAPSGDAPPVRGTSGPSYATTVGPLFEMKCTELCHEPGGALGGPGGFDAVKMDLTLAAGYATLTSGKSIQATDMWIVGETLEDSYLWHKLNDTHLTVGGSGAKMPITGEITEEDLGVVQAWIEGGATP